ncbi:phage baseplate assembly protein [Roseospirillum parvum]|uniref:Mu-like prophage tail protein gpP n=1 Tax=Roseospirillum parvum TaxID=83401 RepID=A0A1G8G200_9PROT|nr:contractile injection system protein, VgrG/Pvc8 family [Roseospirillum parvum]SDH88399.1 Mu-like prophage tail protein gpP [Roseospirillum parvum]
MTFSSDVTLALGGRLWTGWQEVTASAGLEQGAGVFTLSFRARSPDGSRLPGAVGQGARCRLDLAGETVITGWVDEVTRQIEDQALSLTGRDAAGDLIDCSAASQPGEWHGVSLTEIAAALAAPFGVPVAARVDVGAPFGRFRVQEGETVWAAIERACRQRAVLPVSDGLGGLVLTSAEVAGAATVRLTDRALKSDWRVVDSGTGRFSEITVKGQAPGSDDVWGEPTAAISGRAIDPGVRRHRPLTVLSEEPTDATAATLRAAWEVRVRRGRGLRASGTVAGWTTGGVGGGGALWRPGQRVVLDSARLEITRELLIAAVEWRKGLKDGTVTRLELVPPDALARIAEGGEADIEDGGFWE